MSNDDHFCAYGCLTCLERKQGRAKAPVVTAYDMLVQRIKVGHPQDTAAEMIRLLDQAIQDGQRTVLTSECVHGGRPSDEAQQPDRLRDAAQGIADMLKPPTRPVDTDLRDRIEVWPLARVLAEVRCGSQDWTWEEEWADLDRRHAETGYLAKLGQRIRENGITMPVLIGSDGRLWDGHHRLRIAVRLGIGYVPVELTPTTVAILPASADRAAADQPADRRARYAAAIREESSRVDDVAIADAVMAVVDTEIVQAMRAMHDTKEQEIARLRAEREAHRLALSEALGLGTGAPWDAIRDRAAETQQPETEAVATAGPCPDCRHISCRDRTPCNAILSATGLNLARCPCTGQQPNPAPSEEPKDFRAWLGSQRVHGTGETDA